MERQRGYRRGQINGRNIEGVIDGKRKRRDKKRDIGGERERKEQREETERKRQQRERDRVERQG